MGPQMVEEISQGIAVTKSKFW